MMFQLECKIQTIEKIDYLASRKVSFFSQVLFLADFKI